jgi:DNA polymerase-4
MWYALHGFALHALPTSRGMFGHGRVLPPEWRTLEYARSCSRLLLTKAARRMRRDGYYAGLLWLWLDIRNSAWFGQRELPSVQDDHACLQALNTLWGKAQGEIARRAVIVRVGVTLSKLTPASERQFDLFLNDSKERQRCELITNTIDRLNQKFGKRVVTLGHWTPPPGGYAGGKIAYNRIPSAEDFW